MQVETFECTETAAEPVDASAEAIEIIERLGLKGQQELICPAKAANQLTRLPYREILKDELMVYRTLCPTSVAIDSYKASPIPLRVLQVAAHFSELMPNFHLFVWDREDAAIPDPVLVGQKESHDYDWSSNTRFILARWGETLEPFAVLRKRAVDMRRGSLLQQADKAMAEIATATDADIVAGSNKVEWK